MSALQSSTRTLRVEHRFHGRQSRKRREFVVGEKVVLDAVVGCVRCLCLPVLRAPCTVER
jgi:hypothetical protein